MNASARCANWQRRRWLLCLLVAVAQISSPAARAQTGVTGGSAPLENRQPTLVTRYMIALQGVFPNDDPNGTPSQQDAPDRLEPFLGEIKAVPFNFAPRGWALCEGQLLSINQNQALFALIGTTYGGNGVTTFALPDLRGRTPIGAGQAAGLPNYPLGTQVGAAQIVLTVANLPRHSHTVGNGNTAPNGFGAPLDNRQPALALHFLIAANSEILIAPWPQQPTGWSHCNGRLLPRNGHTLLFNHIADLYGGDGVNVFALPDTRGRIVIGNDAVDGSGSWPIALTHGASETILEAAEMPAHSHSVPGGTTGVAGASANTASNYQPSLVMHWIISFTGAYPSDTSSVQFPMVGEMRLLAAGGAAGLSSTTWKPLDGSVYPIDDANALYSLIGDNYGGDGASTFALPDFRNRVNTSASTSLPVATQVGSEVLTISVAEMAGHAHELVPEIEVEQPVGTPIFDAFGVVDFGSVSASGGSVQKTFTIRNVGAMDLTLGSITQDGASDFTVGAAGATTLVPGASTTFTVTFGPPAAGQRTAAIHIPNNDADENAFDVTLVGRRLTHQEEWRQQYFNEITNGGVGADANDFEGDGLSNLLEFAIGGDPKAFTLPPGALTRVGNTLEFRYQRAKRALADGFTFRVEFRDDLASGNWSNAGVTEQVLSEDAQLQQVKASLTIPATQSRGFARVNVSAP